MAYEKLLTHSHSIDEDNEISSEKTALLSNCPTESESSRTSQNVSIPISSKSQTSWAQNFLNIKTCPTCKGTGKVSKDQDDKLVALIPLSDKRLKPKRVWLWTSGTFIFCVIIAVLVTFLLAPRSVRVNNDLVNVEPYNITPIKDGSSKTIGICLYFVEQFNIRNDNFYEIRMRNLTLQINRNSHVTLPRVSYTKDLTIPGRTSIILSVKVKYIMYSLVDQYDPYADLCIKGIINELFSLVSTSFSFATLWNSNEQAYLNNVQYLFCKNSSELFQ